MDNIRQLRLSPAQRFKYAIKSHIKNLLWRVLSDDDGLTHVKVISGASRGTRLVIDIRTEAAYWLGSYDRKVVATIRHLLKPGQIAYDCGAFLGYYAASMRQAV